MRTFSRLRRFSRLSRSTITRIAASCSRRVSRSKDDWPQPFSSFGHGVSRHPCHREDAALVQTSKSTLPDIVFSDELESWATQHFGPGGFTFQQDAFGQLNNRHLRRAVSRFLGQGRLATKPLGLPSVVSILDEKVSVTRYATVFVVIMQKQMHNSYKQFRIENGQLGS